MFNDFVSTYAVEFRTTYGNNKICGFDTEGLIPVVSLCGVLGSLYLLSSVWFVEQVIYDQSCTLMQNVYICNKPVN